MGLNEAIEAFEAAATAPRLAWVRLEGGCNNGCLACVNEGAALVAREAVLGAIDEARASGDRVLLAGREPTLSPLFVEAVSRASGDDGRGALVVSNGRRFSYPPFAREAVKAGLSGATIKLFGASSACADGYTRDPGAHAQAAAGIRALRALGVALDVCIVMHDKMLGEAASLVEVARRLGAEGLWVEIARGQLTRDDDAGAALARMAAKATSLGMRLVGPVRR